MTFRNLLLSGRPSSFQREEVQNIRTKFSDKDNKGHLRHTPPPPKLQKYLVEITRFSLRAKWMTGPGIHPGIANFYILLTGLEDEHVRKNKTFSCVKRLLTSNSTIQKQN